MYLALLACAIGCLCSGFFMALAGQPKFGGGLCGAGIGFWIVSHLIVIIAERT